jgi:hypothetical protein
MGKTKILLRMIRLLFNANLSIHKNTGRLAVRKLNKIKVLFILMNKTFISLEVSEFVNSTN